jgi:hypothetical protein
VGRFVPVNARVETRVAGGHIYLLVAPSTFADLISFAIVSADCISLVLALFATTFFTHS